MSAHRFDPQEAAASVAALAAMTDQQLAAGVREALIGLAAPVMALYATGNWPVSDFDARAVDAFNRAQRVVEQHGVEVPGLEVMVAAAEPVLGMWWSGESAEAEAVQAAVARLRRAAMVLPGLVTQARAITETRQALRHRPR